MFYELTFRYNLLRGALDNLMTVPVKRSRKEDTYHAKAERFHVTQTRGVYTH
jgi:hypothetical protein